jgi:hypothetical protein
MNRVVCEFIAACRYSILAEGRKLSIKQEIADDLSLPLFLHQLHDRTIGK